MWGGSSCLLKGFGVFWRIGERAAHWTMRVVILSERSAVEGSPPRERTFLCRQGRRLTAGRSFDCALYAPLRMTT